MALLRRARLRNWERCEGPIWRPSERWRSWWDGEFESPLLQRRVTSEPIVEKIENKGEPVRKRLMLSRAG
jgi:hypothetical protein